MKKILLIFAVLLMSCTLVAQDEVLTNKSITDMTELGFTEDVIITKINTSKNDFDATIEALKALKEKGISSNIIVAIMNASKETTELNANKPENDRIGIYIKKNGEFVKILPTVFSGSKTNTLASAFTYGIASASMKSTMNKAQSANVVPKDSLIFYFYFAKNQNNDFAKVGNNWWFATATSPNEFALVKLNVNKSKNRRELTTGKVNVYAGSSIGINEEDAIEFSIEQLEGGSSFIVKPKKDLTDGEYCFFYQGTVPQGGISNQSVFDFSVPKIVSKYPIGSTVWISKKGKASKMEICDIDRIEGVIHCIGTFSGFASESFTKKHEYPEDECFPSKKELEDHIQKK